uniref:NADH dehydrogenase subunit 9 n=1 Tax=Ophirina amphinema TaxID=2108040 RepID=A0A348AYT8_9EUKA|nr:NADH dehydrogenase subunit 9 [Ophirina amphinema]
MSNTSLEKFGSSVKSMMPSYIHYSSLINNELVLVTDPQSVDRVLFFLKYYTNSLYGELVDVAGVDYPQRVNRFEVVYQLLSIHFNSRVRVKVITDDTLPVNSVIEVYRSAGWLEREVWDLYGVFFSNHPDLRRILTDYGFEGHPLRKDFPLCGYLEVRYDEEQKRVVAEPLEMTQEFRSFDFISPWESKSR